MAKMQFAATHSVTWCRIVLPLLTAMTQIWFRTHCSVCWRYHFRYTDCKAAQSLFNLCQEVLDSLDMKTNAQKSRCMRIGPRYYAQCVEICNSSCHVIPWANEIRYLGVFITRSRLFKCTLDVSKRSFYRAANAVFGEKKSREQRPKRLLCNWSWANLYRFCCIASKPVH